MTLFTNVASVNLNDSMYFEILHGLWTGKKPPYTKAGVIRNTNFTASGEIDYSDVAWLDVEVKELKKRSLKQGDIIIERSGGGPKQPVGRVVQFKRSDGFFSFSNFTTVVRVKEPNEIDPRFAFYVLLNLYQSGKTDDIQRRTTGLRNLDFKAYKERAIFPLLFYIEQNRISYVLNTIQTAIEQQARFISLTRELKTTIMRRLFSEGLRGEKRKETEIGLVPESWEIRTLEEMILTIDYGTSVKCDYSSKGYPVLRIPNIIGGPINIDDLKFGQPKKNEIKKMKLRKGDLLFVRTNGVQENAGRCSIFDNEIEDCYFASYLIRVRLDTAQLIPEFLNDYVVTEVGKSYLSGRAIRVADGKFNINSGTIRKVLVPVPTIKEQEEIASIIKFLDQKINLEYQKQSILLDLFKTLLHQLMSGQIRVNNFHLPDLL